MPTTRNPGETAREYYTRQCAGNMAIRSRCRAIAPKHECTIAVYHAPKVTVSVAYSNALATAVLR